MMRLSARKFAWLPLAGAVVTTLQVWVGYTQTQMPSYVPPGPFRISLIVAMLAVSLRYAAWYIALGAIVFVLGEIRDQTEQPSDSETTAE